MLEIWILGFGAATYELEFILKMFFNIGTLWLLMALQDNTHILFYTILFYECNLYHVFQS